MTVDPLLPGIASFGLPGARAAWPSEPLPPRRWDALAGAVRVERLHGLLASAIWAGLLPATEPQREAAENAHIAAMRRALTLEQTALRATGALTAEGIDARVLKGMATAHLDEADPALRCFADVDLLIPSDSFDRAVAVAEDLGFERDLPERRRGFDRRFGKEVSLRSGSVELDVHRLLVLGAFGLRPDPGWLWRSSSTFELGGRTLSALDGEHRALHAACAAALSDPQPRLVQVRDLVLLLTNGHADPEGVRALAHENRLDAVLAASIRHAAALFPIDDLPLLAWASSHRPDRWSRAALATYEAQGGSNTLTLLGGVIGVGGVPHRLAYLRDLVLPSRRYTEARRRVSRADEHREGLAELLRWAKKPRRGMR